MSIVRSLLWLVDRIQHREEQAKHERWMKQFATPDPDDGPDPPDLTSETPRAPHLCRVCGRVEPEALYCMSCLADTLTPLKT